METIELSGKSNALKKVEREVREKKEVLQIDEIKVSVEKLL